MEGVVQLKDPPVAQDDCPAVETSAEQESFDSSRDDDAVKKPLGPGMAQQHEHFPMREVIIGLPGGAQLRFNPFVSLLAIAVLWGVAIWCMVAPDTASATVIAWKAQVTELFTWFYVGSNPAFMVRVDPGITSPFFRGLRLLTRLVSFH